MKTLRLSLLLMLCFFYTASAQTITDFSAGQFSATLNQFATLTQMATALQVQGTDNNMLAGTIPSVTIPVNTVRLALTGTLAGINPNTTFTLALVDTADNELDFDGMWSAFTISGIEMTATLNLHAPGVFNGIVNRIALFPGGTEGSPLDFTFNRLEAVPEPASSSLLMISLMGFWARKYIRRRDRR